MHSSTVCRALVATPASTQTRQSCSSSHALRRCLPRQLSQNVLSQRRMQATRLRASEQEEAEAQKARNPLKPEQPKEEKTLGLVGTIITWGFLAVSWKSWHTYLVLSFFLFEVTFHVFCLFAVSVCWIYILHHSKVIFARHAAARPQQPSPHGSDRLNARLLLLAKSLGHVSEVMPSPSPGLSAEQLASACLSAL